ncbi:uncharacterized protein HMPREF1541_04318 [Cyphellophora europaea CBS 101466]|uniref:Xylanolytic transcriptional activator regulatory domain-containing protein n=1 Tax=Cyphellophora europaea (strain CBS 101466) TaxID=1220924 RepID=W2RWA6_CYPE1|nr:uncharacterized protein HMPREF1541_04318 [Cyphellophora europaea CBS 101466]ETN40043.1 hypothetical protein HMPREF1541_04318 [Cyphellophora europaea CBS 101466]
MGWRRPRRQQKSVPSTDNSTLVVDACHNILDGSEHRSGGPRYRQREPTEQCDPTGPVNDLHESPASTGSNSDFVSHPYQLPQANNSVPTQDNTIPGTDVATSIALAENSLFRFFKEGISSSKRDWTMFDQLDHVRTAYVGTRISNMTHLIKLDRRASPSCIIYAYPQIHASPDWRSDSNRLLGLTRDTIQHITAFPAKDIRDNFVDAFFTKINPYFPVIDEAGFRAKYAEAENKLPLLLFHAVLLVGARVSRHPRAVQARHVIGAVLFSRAKQVFDMRHENDRMHLVQAALLFSWHLQDGDNAGANSWYWLGVACRIAFGLGMHRNVLRDPLGQERMPLTDRRIWRRVWWTLFQAETMSALEHGRPPMIRLEDFDQEPLILEDFTETNGAINEKIDFEYCRRNIELCDIALRIMSLSAPRSLAREQGIGDTTSSLKTRLVSWMLDAAPAENDQASESTFAELNLQLHYNAVVIHLYRVIMDQTTSPSDGYDNEAMRISTSAATSIVSAFEAIHAAGMMAQCHFTAVTALSAAAIQASKQLQRAVDAGNSMLAISERHLLDRVCNSAKHLSEFWPSAEGVRKVFQSLFDDFTGMLKDSSRPWDTSPRTEDADNAALNVNWTDFLASASWMQSAHGVYLEEAGWEESLFGLQR